MAVSEVESQLSRCRQACQQAIRACALANQMPSTSLLIHRGRISRGIEDDLFTNTPRGPRGVVNTRADVQH